MADDNDFDQIVEKIRDAITIPTLGLENYYGTLSSFEIFVELNSNGEPTLSPYAGKQTGKLWNDKNMKTVKDFYPEAVNLTNWSNLSFIQTYYNFYNNNYTHGKRLPLEIQGVSNEVVSSLSLPFNLKFKPKSSWEQLLTTYLLKTKGTTGEIADNYFLFFPDADVEIRPQSISFTNNYFGIMCLRWADYADEWIYEAWWFKTPTMKEITRPALDADGYLKPYDSDTQTFFCENSFPLRNFRRSQDDYKHSSHFWKEVSTGDFGEWDDGEAWSINGGGFYLGQDAKPFLDLFPKIKPESTGFGVFNWWW